MTIRPKAQFATLLSAVIWLCVGTVGFFVFENELKYFSAVTGGILCVFSTLLYFSTRTRWIGINGKYISFSPSVSVTTKEGVQKLLLSRTEFKLGDINEVNVKTERGIKILGEREEITCKILYSDEALYAVNIYELKKEDRDFVIKALKTKGSSVYENGLKEP